MLDSEFTTVRMKLFRKESIRYEQPLLWNLFSSGKGSLRLALSFHVLFYSSGRNRFLCLRFWLPVSCILWMVRVYYIAGNLVWCNWRVARRMDIDGNGVLFSCYHVWWIHSFYLCVSKFRDTLILMLLYFSWKIT